MGYLWKLKVGEQGPGIQVACVHFPGRAARRLGLKVPVSSSLVRGEMSLVLSRALYAWAVHVTGVVT